MTRTDPPTVQLTSRAQLTRRDALRLFGASVAMFEVGCLQRTGEEIRPSVRRPETSPGTPQFFATSMVIDGFATGLLAEAHAGRPVKLEGNPAHPASLGATNAQHQASILDLYDPHRLRAPRAAGLPTTWERFTQALQMLPEGELWLILPRDGSATISSLLARVRGRYPLLRVVHHAPADQQNAYRGTELAFGAPLQQQLALDRAEVVVALDADVLGSMPMSVRWAHDFAIRRRAVEPGQDPVRLFVAEPMLTPTGSMADHRLAIRAGDVAALVISLAAALDRRGVATVQLPAEMRALARARLADPGWVDLVASALVRARGAAAIVVGDRQPPAIHALAHRIAMSLGTVGRTTSFIPPTVRSPLGESSLADLAKSLEAGQVGTVIALDTDPLLSAPPALGLAGLLRKVALSAHVTMHATATSAACGWTLPLSHYLETWGDARAWDGTASPIQPLIHPLHDTRSSVQLLAMLGGEREPDERAEVRAQWASELSSDDAWRAVLGEGIIPNSTSSAVSVAASTAGDLVGALAATIGTQTEMLEVDLATSPSIGDGRFANNPWLQELPHPITKLTWSNAAMLSAATASELHVDTGDVIRLSAGGIWLDAPVLVVPGHVDRCITLELGYGGGHTDAPIANGLGVNGYVFAGSGLIAHGVDARATGRSISLARTQVEFNRHGREIGLQTDLASYRRNPQFTADHRGEQPTLIGLPEPSQDIPQWAMTIDTTICTGCSSCVIACQAENNVPVVGIEGVRRGREMHWLRIDTYIDDGRHGLEVVNQPMLCQHCENAPCEYVCPVFATTHSPDGLNEMTYNRCIGTRFCSNNCPYKVRRFNFFGYDQPADISALQHNPDVTVRGRGVMEKCTYCVQRIRAAEHHALMDKRPIAPGEVVTACQQACPTNAIQFGALQHTATPMVTWRKSLRLYGALHEVGTRPRTMYLAKITNPDPEAG
jgi:Fe-S-cluster-containing dehydrogenase component